jgi:NADH-quinone oxidoreductase subunit C
MSAAAEVVERLRERLGDAVAVVSDEGAESRLRSRRECVRDTLEALMAAGYDLFVDLFAVDYPTRPERFELVYHLAQLTGPARVFVHVGVPEADAVAPTVTDLIPGANWPEREIFDLFGVRFDGHPDLRRLLMPDDWQGHPLRKDYPTRGTAPLAPIVVE